MKRIYLQYNKYYAIKYNHQSYPTELWNRPLLILKPLRGIEYKYRRTRQYFENGNIKTLVRHYQRFGIHEYYNCNKDASSRVYVVEDFVELTDEQVEKFYKTGAITWLNQKKKTK